MGSRCERGRDPPVSGGVRVLVACPCAPRSRAEARAESPRALPGSARCARCSAETTLRADGITSEGGLSACLACGHPELWTRKRFPAATGIGIVVAAALLAPSTYYVSLVAAALIDFALYHPPRGRRLLRLRSQAPRLRAEPASALRPRDRRAPAFRRPGRHGRPMRPGGTAGARIPSAEFGAPPIGDIGSRGSSDRGKRPGAGHPSRSFVFEPTLRGSLGDHLVTQVTTDSWVLVLVGMGTTSFHCRPASREESRGAGSDGGPLVRAGDGGSLSLGKGLAQVLAGRDGRAAGVVPADETASAVSPADLPSGSAGGARPLPAGDDQPLGRNDPGPPRASAPPERPARRRSRSPRSEARKSTACEAG
jgi:hypothetical protein